MPPINIEITHPDRVLFPAERFTAPARQVAGSAH